ncbi:PRC-barrel domain-containing protein, partial [Microvirga sp. GCM10011540]|uniref:PRC-barrel domain-containing protein n=1 Tax=Microvirga sp. GCM10011540 TaxID=3317338 RepID=UPI00361D3D38
MKLIAVAALLGTTALASAAVAQTSPSQQQVQQGQVAASQMRNQPVYSSQGEQIGTVNAIVRGRDNQTYAVMTTGQALGERRQVVVPANRIALQGNRVTVRGNEQQLRQLQAYDQNAYQPVQDSERFVVAVVAVPAGQQQAQADGAEIVVRQPQPQVQVEQAQPRVVVQQPQPNVTVRQPRPQIIVR